MSTTTKRMSTRVLATLDTADFADCVNTGYTYTLYSDGHLSAEYRTRWQGSRSGVRYITEPGYVDVGEIRGDDPDSDAEAALTVAAEGCDPREDAGWRKVRNGYVIR